MSTKKPKVPRLSGEELAWIFNAGEMVDRYGWANTKHGRVNGETIVAFKRKRLPLGVWVELAAKQLTAARAGLAS